jgi:hypothetical protein
MSGVSPLTKTTSRARSVPKVTSWQESCWFASVGGAYSFLLFRVFEVVFVP